MVGGLGRFHDITSLVFTIEFYLKKDGRFSNVPSALASGRNSLVYSPILALTEVRADYSLCHHQKGFRWCLVHSVVEVNCLYPYLLSFMLCVPDENICMPSKRPFHEWQKTFFLKISFPNRKSEIRNHSTSITHPFLSA